MQEFLPFFLLDYRFSVLYIIFISIWNLCLYLSKIDVKQKVIIQITDGESYTGVRTHNIRNAVFLIDLKCSCKVLDMFWQKDIPNEWQPC